MKLIFFDESKQGPQYPHYHIGAVCIDESDLTNIENRINAISQEAFGVSDINRETELHAAEIYHRKKYFKDWIDFGRRINLISRLIEILSLDEVLLISIQVNCDLLHENQFPEEIAFMFLCERANDLVKANKSLGMLIGDRENDNLAERFSINLSGYRARGTEFAFGRDITNLVDSVHFTHSHLSRFLQLADIYTWILQFQNRNQGSKNERHCAVFDVLGREGINLFPSKYKVWPNKQLG